MIPISINFVNNVVLDKDFRNEIDQYIKKSKVRLSEWLKESTLLADKDFTAHVQYIKDNLDAIVYAEPDHLFRNLKPKVDTVAQSLIERKREEMGKGENYEKYLEGYKKKVYLKDELVNKKLNYGSFRDKILRKHFRRMGVRACVYCNANWALTIESKKEGREYQAKYQVDHYWPKAIYPCFAISLFNFIPSCSSCNLAKSDNFVNFTMYSNDSRNLEKSQYSFGFANGSRAKWLLDPAKEKLKIDFNCAACVNPELGLIGAEWSDYDATFDITGIYEMFDDIAEEICFRSQAYTPSYRKAIEDLLDPISKEKKITDRMVLGNYATEGEIHKRPLSKFMQDIAREVGLIC